MSWLIFAFSGPVLWAISAHLDKYLVERFFKDTDVSVLVVFTPLTTRQLLGGGLILAGVLFVSVRSGPRCERFRWGLALPMLACGFVLSFSTLIFKVFAVRDEFWATTFWMFAGEAVFGAGFLCL